jgi:hypothetical protein
MQIQLTPKQSEAMDALSSGLYTFITYGGAIRGGKSVWGFTGLLVLCQLFPRSRWCVIREDMEKIRTTSIPSFVKLSPSGKLRQSPYEYTHPNGSVILFKSENYAQDKELDWMKGLEVNGFLFEEINECQKKTLFKAFERAGSWIIPETELQPDPIIMATCNPTFGWFKETVYDKWKNNDLPEGWLYIPAKITDNPHLPQAYIDNLKNLPKFEYMVFVEGNWDVQLKTGGEFYKQFEINKHVGHVSYDPNLPLHISWDDNVNPYLPCGIFQIEGMHVRMIDEIAGITPYNTVKAVCKEIKERYPHHNAGMFVYGDATASKQDTKLEKGHNFYTIILDALDIYRPVSRVANSNPSVVMRGSWLNNIFEIQYGGINITIGENCKKTITDFVSLKEAPDGTKLKSMTTDTATGARYQEFGHFTDLFDYVMCSAFETSYREYMKNPFQEIEVEWD